MSTSRQLARDDRGATMVMGVFMAALLVGMIYYVAGIGEAIMYKERMQDAADASAFAAATMAARAMNVVALLNVVIASVLAVLIALKTALYFVSMAVPFAISYCNACEGCHHCANVVQLGRGVARIEGQIGSSESRIRIIMEMSHQAQQALALDVPLAAQTKVREYASETYHEPTEDGVLWPFVESLPIEPERDILCDKAAFEAVPYAGTTADNYPVSSYLPGYEGAIPGKTPLSCEGESMQVTPGALMGDEPFQLRALIKGNPDFGWTDRGVSVATWGRADEAESYDKLAELGQFSFSQAEFYYDGDIDRDEWLWHMNWSSRLRRFRMSDDAGDLATLCQTMGGPCRHLSGLGELTEMTVH